MQMKNKLKSEKGFAMTVYITTAVITFTVILGAVFLLSATTRKDQLRTLIKIKEVYEQSNSKKEEIYMEQKEKLPTTFDTKPYYPDNTFVKIAGTGLTNGLVIQDSNGNEYVWIEVPKSLYANNDYNTETTTADQKPASSTDYEKIEYCLHKYTDYYRGGTKYKDEYYSDETTGLTSTQYTELKQKMLKSVYENGGFWIGRYEAGIEKNRTGSGNITVAPVSKQGTAEKPIYPYNYVTCSQAQTLANMLTTENYTSSLMFGVQWNLVLKHIEVREVKKGVALATIQGELKKDSSSWGNYYNASFTIDRGKYAKYGAISTWYNYDNELEGCVTYADGTSKKVSASSNSNAIVLTTGSSEICKKMNIYDLSGNVSEITLEYTTYSGGPCVYRGGRYSASGVESGYTTAGSGAGGTGSCTSSNGFRVSLYK